MISAVGCMTGMKDSELAVYYNDPAVPIPLQHPPAMMPQPGPELLVRQEFSPKLSGTPLDFNCSPDSDDYF